MGKVHLCWKCKDYYTLHDGRISKSGLVFTCFDCLSKWEKGKKQQRDEYLKNTTIGQMDFFETVDTLNSVF